MYTFFLALHVVSLCLFASIAHAIPIVGEITFGGTLTSGTPLASTTTVPFGPVAFVTSSTGNLSALVPGSAASFTSFSIIPFSPVAPLWTAGTFRFDLLTLAITQQATHNLSLLGTGILSGVGFDPTQFDWSLSADRNVSGSVVAFSATNSSVVPEPSAGVLLMLGAGLISVSRWLRWT